MVEKNFHFTEALFKITFVACYFKLFKKARVTYLFKNVVI